MKGGVGQNRHITGEERERERTQIRLREMEREGTITEQISVQAKRNAKDICLGGQQYS